MRYLWDAANTMRMLHGLSLVPKEHIWLTFPKSIEHSIHLVCIAYRTMIQDLTVRIKAFTVSDETSETVMKTTFVDVLDDIEFWNTTIISHTNCDTRTNTTLFVDGLGPS